MENLDLTLTKNDHYITENDYGTAMKSIAEPYLKKYLHDGYIKNGSASLYFQSYRLPESNKSIVFSHGFTEFTEKYTEAIYYYLKSGYSVYIMDHRGFGNSYREVSDMSLAYIDDFKTYVDDFKYFIDKIVLPQNKYRKLYLYAHSMGGAIAVDFLESYPQYFDAAVLSSPLMKTNTGRIPELVSRIIAKYFKAIGKGNRYVLGQHGFDYIHDLKGSSALSDARYSYYFDKQLNTANYQVYGASYYWLDASIKETHKIMKKSNLKKIKIPVLLFQAEKDTLVLPEGHYKFDKAVQTCRLVYVKNSKHQIYSSTDEVVIPYFNTIFDFLNKQ